MGNGSGFINARYKEYLTVRTVAGIKVLEKIVKDRPPNTPIFSNTPNTMYARMDKNGKVVQIAVYENGVKIKDIEWGHNHKPYKKGDVHVQDYIAGIRQIDPRDPTPEELELANKIRSLEDG